MLNIMRKNASSLMIKIILGAIVIVFIFFGMNQFIDNPTSRVALVNGEPISIESYRNAYNSAIENLQQQYGGNLSRDMIEMLQIPRQIIYSLVNNLLLTQEAKKLDIHVTDAELAAAIQAMSAFQNAGTFSRSHYEYVLKRNDLTPQIFEASIREEMLVNKLNAFVTSGVKVTEGEILDWYEWINASVAIDYVLFDPTSFKDIQPTEDELEVFYESYQENYKTQPKMKVRYVSFRPDQFSDKVRIDDADIEEYYASNLSDFYREKTIEARHILLSVDEDASPEVVEEKREKAEMILNMAQEGKDFATLAKEYSEGATRETGGLLGEFKKDDMDPDFSAVAFSMEAGEISEPVRTQYGWHLIEVEKVNEASPRPIEEVSDDIREKLTADDSEQLAYEAAEDTFDQALMDEDFEITATKLGLTLHSTDYFTMEGPDSGVSDPEAFASAAFQLMDADISDILDIDDSYYIMQKIGELPSEIPDLAEVETQVRADLIMKMQDEQARKSAEEFLAAVKEIGNMESAENEFNVEVFSSGFFKRSESIPGIGYESEIIQAAFSLSDVSKIADTVFPAANGYYVIQLSERKSPDTTDLDTQKDTIKAQLISQKRQIVFESWLEKIKSESEINIEKGYLD